MTKNEINKFKNMMQMYFDSTKNDRDFIFYEERVFFGMDRKPKHCLHIVRFEMADKIHINHYVGDERKEPFLKTEMFEFNGRNHEIQCINLSSEMERNEELYNLRGEVLNDLFKKLGYILVKAI